MNCLQGFQAAVGNEFKILPAKKIPVQGIEDKKIERSQEKENDINRQGQQVKRDRQAGEF